MKYSEHAASIVPARSSAVRALGMSTSTPSVAGGLPGKSFSFRTALRRPRACVSIKLLVGLAIVCGAPAASRADERAVVVEVAPTAPFDALQLAAAVRLRVPPSGPPVRIRVFATADGVRIEARGSAREVALAGLTGSAAARLVALAAADLLVDDLDGAPIEPPSLTARVAAPQARGTIAVLGSAMAWSNVLGGLSVDVALPTGSWLVAFEAGGGTLVDGPLQLTAAMLRIGAGARSGVLDARATATIMPVLVGDGTGDRTILAAIGASARLHIPIAATVHGVFAVGIDLFATRTAYVIDDMQVLRTPRGAPWLAAGLEVSP